MLETDGRIRRMKDTVLLEAWSAMGRVWRLRSILLPFLAEAWLRRVPDNEEV